jgi:hypothetical protein
LLSGEEQDFARESEGKAARRHPRNSRSLAKGLPCTAAPESNNVLKDYQRNLVVIIKNGKI